MPPLPQQHLLICPCLKTKLSGSPRKVCPITGKKPRPGNNISHASNKPRRRWEPNLQWKRIWIPSDNRFVCMRVSTHGLRTIHKLDLEAALLKGRRRLQELVCVLANALTAFEIGSSV
jgi:large subunit ribosomal protein L28